MEKTGSSSLQEYLYRYRDRLRETGIIYPDLGHRSHWLFAAALGGDRAESHYFERRIEKRNLTEARDEAVKTVRTDILDTRPGKTVVLSHESLGKPLQCKKLRSFLLDCGVRDNQFIILSYVREPVEHFRSSIQQTLKNKGHDVKPPNDWKSHHVATAERVLSTFGRAAHFRAYGRDTLVDGDIVSDFRQFMAQQLSVNLPLPSSQIMRNTSLSGEACALLEIAKEGRGRQLVGREFVMLRGALFKYDRDLGRTKLEVPEDWSAWVAVANHERWNVLVERLPYDESIKRRLRLDNVIPSKPVSKSDVKSWITSYYDPDYTTALARVWTENLKWEVSPAAGVLAWLVDSPSWMSNLGRKA